MKNRTRPAIQSEPAAVSAPAAQARPAPETVLADLPQASTDGETARRANKGGIRFTRLGENLAGNSDLADAHRMLMNSPTHRANILDPSFQRIGLAVVRGGPYGYMIVEEFIVPAPTVATRPVASNPQPGTQSSAAPPIASTTDAASGHAR